MCVTVEFNNWIVFTPSNMYGEINPFLSQIKQVASQQNFNVPMPNM